jgi:small-conductance mechanosensitive channel
MLPLSIVVGIKILRKPISPVYLFYHRAFLLLALFASFWGLVSYVLAGNWTFSFSNTDRFKGSEQAFSVFRYYTAIIISLTIFLLIVFGIHHLIIKTKKK